MQKQRADKKDSDTRRKEANSLLKNKGKGKNILLKKMRPYVSLIKDQSVAMLKDRLLFEAELKKNEEMATEQWRNEEAKMKDREHRLHRTRRHTATIKYSK